ncbi:winged helix-turn-helix transcriptional regulator [Natrinema versiforme]
MEYSLTELGESLEPVIVEMRDWGREHLAAASDEDSSIA